jgi:hypothetical protein
MIGSSCQRRRPINRRILPIAMSRFAISACPGKMDAGFP